MIDLRARFSLAENELTQDSRIMVLNVGRRTIGIVVDSVNEVLRVSQDQISPAPPTVASLGNQYMTGLVRLEEQLLILLDVDRLFGEEATAAMDDGRGQAKGGTRSGASVLGCEELAQVLGLTDLVLETKT